MAELHVAGVSIAAIHNGRIEWAKGYGARQIGGDSVNADTLFQAGFDQQATRRHNTLKDNDGETITLEGVTYFAIDQPSCRGLSSIHAFVLLAHSARPQRFSQPNSTEVTT
jgi:hypothetical protein